MVKIIRIELMDTLQFLKAALHKDCVAFIQVKITPQDIGNFPDCIDKYFSGQSQVVTIC